MPTKHGSSGSPSAVAQRRDRLLPVDDVSICVDAVDLEPVFGEIQTDGGNLHGGRLLSFVAFTDDHVVAHRCRERGSSTPSRIRRKQRA
jgi:hypothetical protein